jgi:hypothetical protein
VYPKKFLAMQYWPHPKTLKILHGFLGLMGYYRKFVKKYGKIDALLKIIIKNNSFVWSKDTKHTFSNLKESMCTFSRIRSA